MRNSVLILILVTFSNHVIADTWECSLGAGGTKHYFKENLWGNYEVKIGKDGVWNTQKPVIKANGITLFATSSNHEGFTVYLSGFSDHMVKIDTKNIELNEIDFSDHGNPIAKELIKLKKPYKVYMEQWIPMWHWNRIGEIKTTERNQGVYGYSPFKSSISFGYCIPFRESKN